MGTRVPVEPYNLRSANSSYIGGGGSTLHDLNTADATRPEMEAICRGDHDSVTEDSLDNDAESSAVDCLHEPYRNSLPLHGVGVEEDRSSLENDGSSRNPYNILTINDVSPIETARARFLDIVVDHFISSHVIEVEDSEESDYTTQTLQDKLSKRKSRETRYEGDARFVLPLMYVANLYETLVSEVNHRLSSLNGMREKTISVALEAAGGLYRKLAKKFPRKGSCVFKRRELATSFETRSRFPELVIQEEKRVRFVVVNGLDIVDKPSNMRLDDAEWFKRLTGRNDAVVSARDYKFYAPRHKYRRVSSSSDSNIPGLPTFPGTVDSSPQGYRPINEHQNPQQTPTKQQQQHMQMMSHIQGQFHHPLHNHNQQQINQSQHHFCHSQQQSQLPEIAAPPPSSTLSQHMACLQTSLTHVGGSRLHVLPTSPAKFCDECGAPYLRETSKFCSECGARRLGS